MRKINKNRFIFILFLAMFIINFNFVSAKGPIKEYKIIIEEQKIKRAQFIWSSCLEEMRVNNELDSEDIEKVNNYLKESVKSENNVNRSVKYDIEKKSLRISNIDEMVKNKIITEYQGKILEEKFNKYDLRYLEK